MSVVLSMSSDENSDDNFSDLSQYSTPKDENLSGESECEPNKYNYTRNRNIASNLISRQVSF